MGFMAENDPVAKGPVTRCLDEVSARPDARARLEELRGAIKALHSHEFRGLEGVLADHLLRHVYEGDYLDRIKEYLRTNWFDERTGWWPAFQPVAPIYALGLLQGLNTSLEGSGQPLPFDSYWIIGHGQVEVLNLASQRQITLLIATPQPPEHSPSRIAGVASKAWVTARRAGSTEHEVNPVSGQTIGAGSPELRVRTFAIRSHPPRRS